MSDDDSIGDNTNSVDDWYGWYSLCEESMMDTFVMFMLWVISIAVLSVIGVFGYYVYLASLVVQ